MVAEDQQDTGRIDLANCGDHIVEYGKAIDSRING
ncbi:hypothetical protein COLO4_08501 [Corchorus olitorius]|uniref:Uncharacterized protein n=1 Tax=Corchorus olitorius TaxID=93759 RepID=A0A1R3KFK8_9ROSI|nr:hypothetical protein COLO4_08501 [Corchorus olitorius]